jgi:hypothetical protein
MKFAIIFETLLMVFHSANSFQIVNGNEEDILAFGDTSVNLNAKANNWFQTCRLMKDGHEICQVTLSTWSPYSATVTCASNYMQVKYTGSVQNYVCKFEVSNLRKIGNNQGFLHCTSAHKQNLLSSVNLVLL